MNDVVSHTTAASVGDVPTLLAQGVLELTQRDVTHLAAASGDPLAQLREENAALQADRAEHAARLQASEAALVRLREELAKQAEENAALKAEIEAQTKDLATVVSEREELKAAFAKLHADLDAATTPAVETPAAPVAVG